MLLQTELKPGLKSCRGGVGKERISPDVASNGLSSSCMGLSGEARSTESTVMRKWDRKGPEKNRGLTTKVGHFRVKKKHQEDEKSIWAARCMMKEEKMVENNREGEWRGEKGCWQSTESLEVMDGLSRLARLSIRRAEVVKRNAEINTPHRILNYKESRKCVVVYGKGEKRFVLWLTLCELLSGQPQQDECGIYWTGERSLQIQSSSTSHNCVA